MAQYPKLTNEQQQSITDSGGYYDSNGNWVDMSGTNMGQTSTQGSGVNPWVGILAALGGVGGGALIRNMFQNNAVPPQLSQLLQMGVDRAAYQNPLFQATTQGTYRMLPNFATEGTKLSGTLSNQPPAPNSGSAGGGGSSDNPLTSLNPLRNPLLAAALGKAASDAAHGNIPFSDVMNGLKKLFGGNTNLFGGKTTTSGTNPFGTNLPGYQNWWFNDPSMGTATGPQQDPSGGTGVGPGMQDYYNWLGNQPNTSNGGGEFDWSSLPGYGTSLPGPMQSGGDGGTSAGDWWGNE